MTNVLANLARVVSTTTGTGTLTLGSAVAGSLTFALAGVTNGQIVTYAIEDYDGGGNVVDREIGRGTYTSSGTTLSRDTVYSSTNSGSKISCSGNQHVFITAAKQDFEAYPNVYNVKLYGAIGDGTTEDHVAIQAAIDAASTAGGGTVYFPGATYLIGATLTLKSKVKLAGEHYAVTVLKSKTNLNSDLVKTANYASLTGANEYLIADGVPYGFGIEHLTLDGNKANQSTSGDCLVTYGKKFTLNDLVIYNAKDIGWKSEGWYTVGTATFPEEPECFFTNVDVQNCGSHGIQYRGPSDSVWVGVFSHQNTGWGLRVETDSSTYTGSCDIEHCHIYANTAGGIYCNSKIRGGHIATESNFGQGLVDAGFGSTYGYIESYINCRTTGTHAIELSGNGIEVARLWNADGGEAVSGLLLSGSFCRVNSGLLNGDASTGAGLTLAGSQNHVAATVYAYSGTGGKGVIFGYSSVGLNHSTINIECYNNKQGYNVATQGVRTAGSIGVHALTTQTVVGTDFDASSAVDVRSYDVDTAASVSQRLIPAGSVSVPGVAFSADRNTGIFSSAADILNVTAGGVEVARFITSGGTGLLSIGGSASLFASPGGQYPLFQLNRTSAQAGAFLGCWQNNAAAAAQVVLAKSKSGTVNTHAVVANNDVIGELHFAASDGTNFIPAAIIKAEVDGTPGTNDMPTRLIFGVTADAGSTVTERIRINANGTVSFVSTIQPSANDGAALGTTALGWSDLHLATGAVINVANGNAVITHSSGIWTVSTGEFRVASPGTNADSVITITATQTLSNKTLSSPTISGGTIQSRVQTSSETTGTLSSTSANKTVVCTGGVTLPNSVFTAGDIIMCDPGTSNRTFTRGSGIAMYLNGTDVASATLGANKTGVVYYRSASVVVLSGGFA